MVFRTNWKISTVFCTDTVPFPNIFSKGLVEASDEETVDIESPGVEV